MIGRNMMRRGRVHANRPAGGAPGAAVTATGTAFPAGVAVEVSWAAGTHTRPVSGWVAGQSDRNGNWSVATALPAAGTWYLWVRRKDYPQVAEPVGPVVVA